MLEQDILKFFAQLIETELGIVYSPDNYYQLKSRLIDVAQRSKIKDLDTLYFTLRSQPRHALVGTVLDVATNNETSFFRDIRVFHAIRQKFEEFFKNQDIIRIFSAACSTGQEPISVSLLIEKMRMQISRAFDYEILAMDVSERALQQARSGIFSHLEIQRGLPPEFLESYFLKTADGRYAVSPMILKKIKFESGNLRSETLGSSLFDFILCRNVLIYQRLESRRVIIKNLANLLRPGGYLVLGAGESLLDLSDDFDQESIEGTFLYKKKLRTSKL